MTLNVKFVIAKNEVYLFPLSIAYLDQVIIEVESERNHLPIRLGLLAKFERVQFQTQKFHFSFTLLLSSQIIYESITFLVEIYCFDYENDEICICGILSCFSKFRIYINGNSQCF